MSPTNYRDLFQFETLTPVVGQPDFESLTTLKNQLKANAQSVPSTLGGGNHGMLGMVLSDLEYALVSNVAFVMEPYPGNLHIPAGTTAIQAKVLESAHNHRMSMYQQCIGVKNALVQQIVKAVEDEWLKPLRNGITNSIDRTIPEILHYLFQQYGDVSPDS